MELIRKLGTRKNKNGNLISYGIFLCSFCLQEVEKNLSHGKRDKSCGCVSNLLTALFHKGRKRLEKTKQLMKSNHLDFTDENNPFYGKKHTEEVKNKNREFHLGKKHTEEAKQKIAKATKGNKHWNWQDGKSFEEYPQEFFDIRGCILERDNYTCQNPDCEHKTIFLNIHHIDYGKQNNNPENLITLCSSCHMKTNFKREYYIKFYQNIMINKLMECLL